jgi:outer membrane biosynthesis protein TonB
LLRKQTFKIAFIVSILLHVLILVAYRPLARVNGLLGLEADHLADMPKVSQPLVFELVETPDDAKVEEPPKETAFLSDKNAQAQDMDPSTDKPSQLPKSKGQTDYKVFAGKSGNLASQSRVSTQPSPDGKQGEDRDKNDMPEKESLDLQNKQELFSENRRTQQFSPDMLRGSKSQNRGLQRDFMDDANWKNEDFSADALGGVSLNTYAWDFAPYILAMKRRIKKHVYPPPAFYQLGAISGQTILKFRVFPSGKSDRLEVISYKGHKALMETSVNAVKASDPFMPLPDDFPENYLELTWTFVYSIHR